jgi:hypothetical protein
MGGLQLIPKNWFEIGAGVLVTICSTVTAASFVILFSFHLSRPMLIRPLVIFSIVIFLFPAVGSFLIGGSDMGMIPMGLRVGYLPALLLLCGIGYFILKGMGSGISG